GWLFEDPRVGGNPGNLRLPENLTWVARELEKVFATRPRNEWLDLLEAADCPAAPVNEPGTWLDHDQVRALGLRQEAGSDTGPEVVRPGRLVSLSRTRASAGGPAASSWPSVPQLRPLWPEGGTPARRAAGEPLSPAPLESPGDPGPQPPLAG